jgi:hypothetical protein
MDSWGSKLVATVDAVAAMAAVGFGLPQTAFRDRMVRGPHLLAPTGSDLAAHGKAGTVLAGMRWMDGSEWRRMIQLTGCWWELVWVCVLWQHIWCMLWLAGALCMTSIIAEACAGSVMLHW